MMTFRGEIDKNDLEFVTLRYGRPIAAMATPIKKGRSYPNTSRFLLRNGDILSVFHSKPIYYLHQNGQWRPLYEVAAYYGNRKGLTLKEGWEKAIDFGFLAWYGKRRPITIEVKQGRFIKPLNIPLYLNTTSTFYPDPDPESTSVDGYVGRLSVDQTFGSIRGGAGTNTGHTSTEHEMALYCSTTSNQYQHMYRILSLFDTSAIPDTDTISSGTYSFKTTADALRTGAGNHLVNISVGTSASNTTTAASDYESQPSNSTKLSTGIALGSMSTSTYQDYVLNASGLANISKTGVSKFCLRYDDDIDNTTDELAWSSGASSFAGYSSADKTGTSEDPKLVVVHSAAAVAISKRLMLMSVGS